MTSALYMRQYHGTKVEPKTLYSRLTKRRKPKQIGEVTMLPALFALIVVTITFLIIGVAPIYAVTVSKSEQLTDDEHKNL